MNEKINVTDTASLKKLFQNDKTSTSPYIYFPISTSKHLDSPLKITRLISGYKKSGFGGIIPYSGKDFGVIPLTEEYYDIYKFLKKEADTNSLKFGYLDDTYIMREYLTNLTNEEEAVCTILNRYEYECTENQDVNRKLKDIGVLMSLVAVSDDLRIIDLRDSVKDGMLVWTVPEGNWTIEEYVCVPDIGSNYINFLDYDISAEYIRKTFGSLIEKLKDPSSEESPVGLFIYRNIMYAGKNRRMWHTEFNKTFEELYGFDPAPYYPLMFRDFSGYSKRYKCMLMKCRSKMMVDGYLKAVSDFCRARDIFCTGFPAESKATACSWLFGDGQLIHRYASAPGLAMPFAYLYGLNAVKVAAGAADIFGSDTVSADLFNYYEGLSKDIIYREAMNAFVRGVNMIFSHLGEDRANGNGSLEETETTWGSIFSKGDDLADFASFASRVQAVLRGGEHISEVAIVYPIHSLHSFDYLYESEQKGFEYPSLIENADYMELMNDFLNYVGIDSTFIHPSAITENSFAEDGVLYLNNDKNNIKKFKILVLPSMSIISLKTLRIAKKFFDEGGKIIATDNLPTAAVECSAVFKDINESLNTASSEDKEVREIIAYLFGEDATDNTVLKSYYKQESPKGGVAYFLPSNRTSVDGTDTVNADILYQATAKFEIAPDVYIDNMPRIEFMGIVNYNLPDFKKVEIDKRLAKGCSMNYIHKRYAGTDIYFITNTTGKPYHGNILLRGRHNPEEWNPYNGKTKKLSGEFVKFRGEVYTLINTHIEASSCVFIVSPIQRTQREIMRDITEEEHIREFFPKINF